MSVFQKWACVDVVVSVVGHSAWNYEGGGVWYVDGGPCRSPPLSISLVSLVPVRGDVSGVLRNTVEPRNYLDGSTGLYRSAYP